MRWAKLLLLLFLVLQPGITLADELSDSQLNKGLRNSDTYSYLLIEKAHADSLHMLELLKKALLYSPDLPAVYFELSKAVFSFSADGILNSVDYIIQGIEAYSRNFWWSFTLFGGLFFGVMFSLVFAFALIVIVRLANDTPLVSHDIEETFSRGLILVVIMVLSLASPLLFIGGTLILLGLYMKKYDRAIVYLFLVLLAFYPFFTKIATTYVRTASSGVVKAIVKVNGGEDNGYAISLLKDERDFASSYSYALALKREGRYEEAIAVYKRLLEKRRDPAVYVNLGNCYVGMYNFAESNRPILQRAIESYNAAVNIKPISSAYYNLSQVYREMLDFAAWEQYFKLALAADRTAVSGYRAIAARTANRFVMDETLAPSDIWDVVFERSNASPHAVLSSVSPFAISLASVILLVLFYLLDTLWRQHSFRCKKCGTILCFKCEKRIMWGEMCPRCFGSLIKLDELDVKERVAWLLGIYDQQRRHREAMKVLSFTFPGLSHIYAGRILTGFLFLWPFLFFLMLFITLGMFVPDSRLISHGFFRWAALWISIGLYIICNYFINKRITKGWL